MQTYDDVHEIVANASYNIDDTTANYVFDQGEIPDELRRKLISVQTEIDRLARLARTHVENHEGNFGPEETYFQMPATLDIKWSRTDQALVSVELRVDTSWSPGTVTDEDDNTIASDDNQCTAWRRALQNELHGYQIT